jgi:hypothetical protein
MGGDGKKRERGGEKTQSLTLAKIKTLNRLYIGCKNSERRRKEE